MQQHQGKKTHDFRFLQKLQEQAAQADRFAREIGPRE
jgi:hypothetical protein